MGSLLHFTLNFYNATGNIVRRLAGSLEPFDFFNSRFGSLRSLSRSLIRIASCLFVLVAMPACEFLNPPELELYSAATNGDIQTVQRILQRRPDFDVNRMPGETTGPPLVAAASFGKHEIARLLLAHKADPNLGSALSGSPLNSAAYHGDIEMCRILVAGGANVNLRSGRHMWTPLENARYKGHTAVVEFLKSAGALQ